MRSKRRFRATRSTSARSRPRRCWAISISASRARGARAVHSSLAGSTPSPKSSPASKRRSPAIDATKKARRFPAGLSPSSLEENSELVVQARADLAELDARRIDRSHFVILRLQVRVEILALGRDVVGERVFDAGAEGIAVQPLRIRTSGRADLGRSAGVAARRIDERAVGRVA